MAEFEELKITISLVDNASAGLAQLRSQLSSLSSFASGSAANLNTMATSLTATGQAATAATRGLQQVTQQTNAAGRAANTLNRDLVVLNRATTDLTRGFQSLAIASQRDLGAALPLLAQGVGSLTTGLRGLGTAMEGLPLATRAVAIGIGGISIALLAGVAAYGAYQVSVFNFAKEMKGLGDTAKQMGVSFADLRHATVYARQFGIAQEAMIGSFAGIQRAMTDLYQNQSQLRQKLISEGLDPGWLRAWENENDEVERLAQAQQKMIDIRNEHRRRGATEGQATGIMRQFAQDIGVDPRLADKPLIGRIGSAQRAEYEKVFVQSKAISDSWDRISARIDGLKSRLLGIGLPGVEKSMERLERWLASIKDEDIEAFFRTIGGAVEKVAGVLGGEMMKFANDLLKIFSDIKAIYDYLKVPLPERAARNIQAQREGQEERNKRGYWENFRIEVLEGIFGKTPPGVTTGPMPPGAAPMRFMGGGQPTPGTAGAPRFGGGLPGNWGNVPLSDNIIDLRKRDEQGELVEENTDVLSDTNELLKSLNEYLDELTPNRRTAAGDGTGTAQGLLGGGVPGPGGGGNPAAGGAGVGAGGGAGLGGMPGGNVPGAGGAGAGGAGVGGATSEALLDAIQKQEGYFPGSRAHRNNNPGNIKFGPFAKEQGATGADESGHAIFPDYQTGRKALGALLQTPKYAGKSIAEIGKTYAEDPKWAEGVAKSLGVGTDHVPGQESATTATPGTPGAAVDLAMTQAGLHEKKDRDLIHQYLKTGGAGMDPAQVPWCAAFVNSSLAQVGLKGLGGEGRNIASNYAAWGQAATGGVQKGDVLVRMQGARIGQTGAHVGMATGRVDPKTGRIEMVSGNTEGGRVSTTWEDPRSVVARRAIMDQSQVARAGTPNIPQAAAPSIGPGGREAGMQAREFGAPAGYQPGVRILDGERQTGVRILDGDRAELDRGAGDTTVSGRVDVNVNAPRGTSVERDGELFKRGRHTRSTQMAPTDTVPSMVGELGGW